MASQVCVFVSSSVFFVHETFAFDQQEATDRFDAELTSERSAALHASSITAESPPRSTSSAKHASGKHSSVRAAIEKAPVGRVYIKQRSADVTEEVQTCVHKIIVRKFF